MHASNPPSNPDPDSFDKLSECVGVISNNQNTFNLVLAFFGLITALKIGKTEAYKKITKRLTELGSRHAL